MYSFYITVEKKNKTHFTINMSVENTSSENTPTLVSSDELEDTLAKYVVYSRESGDKNMTLQSLLRSQGVEEIESLKLRGPGIYWVTGKTMSGKTNAITNLLRHLDDMVVFTVKDKEGVVSEQPVEEVHYFFQGVWQENPFDELEGEYNVQFHNTCPTSDEIHEICKDKMPRILILDDMMNHITDSKDIVELLTKQVHHMNIMVFLITQMLHPTGKFSVGLRAQGHGYFFFQITADEQGLRRRFKALTDKRNLDAVMRFYEASLEQACGYMYADCHSLQTLREFKFFRNIFPSEGVTQALQLPYQNTSGKRKRDIT